MFKLSISTSRDLLIFVSSYLVTSHVSDTSSRFDSKYNLISSGLLSMDWKVE